MQVQPLLFIRVLIWCLMSQTETVLSQDRATWHAEEWQGGYQSEYPLLYTWANGYVGVSVFAFSSVAAATWTREHLSLYPERWTDRTSWCKAAGCRAGHSGDVTERNLTILGFVLFFFFFLKKLTSEMVPVHFLMETCIFLVYLFPLCDVVISDIVKHPSLYIVCTAPLSAGMCRVSSLAL